MIEKSPADSSYLGMTSSLGEKIELQQFNFYLQKMKPIGTHNYFVYITTNKNKTVLYVGVTNDLFTRLIQHHENAQPVTHKSFAGKYNTYYLLYYERFGSIEHAIEREKEIKGWRRSKKEQLIISVNPEWKFLNDEVE